MGTLVSTWCVEGQWVWFWGGRCEGEREENKLRLGFIEFIYFPKLDNLGGPKTRPMRAIVLIS